MWISAEVASKLRVIAVIFNDLYSFTIIIYPQFCCEVLVAMNNYEFSLLNTTVYFCR